MTAEAQEQDRIYVEAWSEQHRRELAQKAYIKWINKKHSLMLKETTEELENTKERRENAERKMKIRRAMLRTKLLCELL